MSEVPLYHAGSLASQAHLRSAIALAPFVAKRLLRQALTLLLLYYSQA